MPRVKGTKTTAVVLLTPLSNGVINGLVSNTENVVAMEKLPAKVKAARNKKVAAPPPPEDHNEAAVVMVEKPPKKAPTSGGRGGKKKALKSVEVEEIVLAKKPAVAKGRGKKAPEEIEIQAEVVMAKGRPVRGGAKKPLDKEMEAVSNGGELETNGKTVKSAAKGRKKKDLTPVLEMENDDADIAGTSKEKAGKRVLTKKPAKAKAKGPAKLEVPQVEKRSKSPAKTGQPSPSPKRKASPAKVVAPAAVNKSPPKAAKKVELSKKPPSKGKKRALLDPPTSSQVVDAVAMVEGEEEQPIEEEDVPQKKSRKVTSEKVEKKAPTKPIKVALAKPVEEPKARGRKRGAAAVAAEDLEADADGKQDGGKPSKAAKKTPLNATATNYAKADFQITRPPMELDAVEPFNLKISSWNVAGLRSWLKKDGLQFVASEEPDIFCMQETKCTTDMLPDEAARLAGYHPYWLCQPGGHAGVGIYSKIMPIHVEYGIGNAEYDDAAGRVITAEYEKFFLVNVYVPNSGRKLVNLDSRMCWEELFQAHLQQLDARKPVIVCGDMNVSHEEIDLSNPKTNMRNAGFTREERDKMTELLALGYVDTFRHLYPERTGAYTFWTYMGNARARNVGWRLDYFIVSKRLIERVVDNCIRAQCLGSDHCPITLYLKL